MIVIYKGYIKYNLDLIIRLQEKSNMLSLRLRTV